MQATIRRIPPVLVLGFGLLLGLLLVTWLLAPRVTAVLPASTGEPVPSTSTIRIEFNRPMNPASVESHFSTEPALDGRFEWDGDGMRFIPESSWPNGGEVEITLRAGALGEVPLPLLRTKSWTFKVGLPRIAYLWPADEKSGLYATVPGSNVGPEVLIEPARGVIDYTLSADGTQVLYVVVQEDGEHELRRLDLISGTDLSIHTCNPQEQCLTPALSPDGAWVTFLRQGMGIGAGGRLVLQTSQIWVMEADGGEPFLVSPVDHTCADPGWSPQGWLTYYDQQLRATAMQTVDGGPAPAPFTYVPNTLGAGGSWSPEGERYLFPDIIFPDPASAGGGTSEDSLYYSHLFQTDLSTGRSVDLSGSDDPMVEDASPAFSPDGQWIAFARKHLDFARWSPGRQLWQMRQDGSSAEPLTNQPNYNFSSISWSPDSTLLAFIRRSPSELEQGPEIWWLDPETGELAMLVAGGYLPTWIP